MEKLRIEIEYQEGLPGWVCAELHTPGAWQFDAFEDGDYFIPWEDAGQGNQRRILKSFCRLTDPIKGVFGQIEKTSGYHQKQELIKFFRLSYPGKTSGA